MTRVMLTANDLDRVVVLTASDNHAVATRALAVLHTEAERLRTSDADAYIALLLRIHRREHWLAWWIVLDRR